ncbi:carbohydrate porin [Niveibacterium umoris]|uniref:Maltoporin n=1 Tax=Niveibacterium umoris TaxID=1193620 RepID=A0A840BRV4_9RHOO|nr:carbohydrate porin [Niveibacterium umoris]MBB4013127.1 maltoporin [Niveibacterium umoris]
MKKQFPMRVIAAALMLAGTSALAAPGLSSNGYFRAGFGASKDGSQACFGLGPAKYRLGNECDNYGEFGLDVEGPAMSNGTVWKGHAMLTGWKGYPDSINGASTSWSQLYLSGHNLGTGVLQGASIWAGRRYYDRPDIHILDYKYQQSDGDGAGVENLDFGFGKFSYAIERTAVTWRDSSKSDDDTLYYANLLKLESVKIHDNGYLTFNGGFSTGKESRDQKYKAEGGWYGGVFYDAQLGDLNAWNRVGIQYGKGSMANGNFGQINTDAAKEDTTTQFLDNVSYTSGDGKWTALANIIYRKDKRADLWKDQTWFSVGARPHYHFDDIWGVATELGWSQLKSSGDEKTRTLSKATVALTAAAGRTPYSRPELRVFYTVAKWNEEAKGWVAYDTYGTQTSGSSFGIQAESWW